MQHPNDMIDTTVVITADAATVTCQRCDSTIELRWVPPPHAIFSEAVVQIRKHRPCTATSIE